jgi:hypothetical protein
MNDWKSVMRIRSKLLAVALGAFFIASPANAKNLCTRLPLSYLGADEAEATAGARRKLKQYAVETLTERGWSGKGELSKRDEVVTCEPYLSIGPLSTGQRCRITATFCTKSVQVARPKVRVQPKTRTQSKARTRTVQAAIRREQVTAPRPVRSASPLRRPEPVARPSRVAAPRKATVGTGVGGVVRLRLRGSSYEISGVLKKYDKLSYVIAPPNSQNITVPADQFECIAGACPQRAN